MSARPIRVGPIRVGPIRVGFVGLQPGAGWGTRAHLPALHGLGDDLRHGTRQAPTFNDAVAFHQILAAIERAAETGCRVRPSDM